MADLQAATQKVLQRVQAVDPAAATRIIGWMLAQPNARLEMFRLALASETSLRASISFARKALSLPPLATPQSPPPSPVDTKCSRPHPGAKQLGNGVPRSREPDWDWAIKSEGGIKGDGGFRSQGGLGDMSLRPVGAGVGLPGTGGPTSPVSLAGGGYDWRPLKVCTFWMKGTCYHGSRCRYRHDAVREGDREGDEGAGTSGSGPLGSQASMAEGLLDVLGAAHHQAVRGGSSYTSSGGGGNSLQDACTVYLTFPPESTFNEEDVYAYFRLYGVVASVRISSKVPRMFAFVTFRDVSATKIVLAACGPHCIAGCYVRVKPFKSRADRDAAKFVPNGFSSNHRHQHQPPPTLNTHPHQHPAPQPCAWVPGHQWWSDGQQQQPHSPVSPNRQQQPPYSPVSRQQQHQQQQHSPSSRYQQQQQQQPLSPPLGQLLQQPGSRPVSPSGGGSPYQSSHSQRHLDGQGAAHPAERNALQQFRQLKEDQALACQLAKEEEEAAVEAERRRMAALLIKDGGHERRRREAQVAAMRADAEVAAAAAPRASQPAPSALRSSNPFVYLDEDEGSGYSGSEDELPEARAPPVGNGVPVSNGVATSRDDTCSGAELGPGSSSPSPRTSDCSRYIGVLTRIRDQGGDAGDKDGEVDEAGDEAAESDDRASIEDHDLTCSVCLDFFTDPIALDCHHTFCVGCISQVIKTTNKEECPVCRAKVGNVIVLYLESKDPEWRVAAAKGDHWGRHHGQAATFHAPAW